MTLKVSQIRELESGRWRIALEATGVKRPPGIIDVNQPISLTAPVRDWLITLLYKEN